MKNVKITLSYGILGGLMLVLIHLLGSVIYYVAGILIPFAFIISIWLALNHTYKNLNYFNFLLFFKVAISVFAISYLINIIYGVLTNVILGDAYGVVLLFGLILSLIMTFVFQLGKQK